MPPPKTTGPLLQQLRTLMKSGQFFKGTLNAYIVPSYDAHSSEYLAPQDKRRVFISGFTGSAGTAVITDTDACMWTDGRYFLQASEEMDCNWTLMKEGVPSTPSQAIWLSKHLPPSSNVGVDPKLMPYNIWRPLETQLEENGHSLVPVETNLIDVLWTDKALPKFNPIKPLESKFSGKSIKDKFADIRKQMKDKNANILVLTALDEVAWFLNLRGSDIEFNPVFFSYAIIHQKGFTLLINNDQSTPEIEKHLNAEAEGLIINIRSYDKIQDVLKETIDNTPEGNIWLSDNANYALIDIVPSNRLRVEITPVSLMKAVKNEVEINGMRNSHIKDGAALCCYFSWLERTIQNQIVTEISGATQLNKFRQQQENYVGPSFETISSVGPHGAIIHYTPSSETDVPITNAALYLCDSGGQFKDGTTDVTRTFHFGTPTDYEKECFTRVLKGQLKLARCIFPTKIKGNCLDSFARQYLWEVGLDYAHGTGHGIGSYLNVHEGPMGISWRNIPDDPGLEAGMFLSNEPGYYENGKFGIRIEDIVQIVPASPPHNFNDRGYLMFDTITLVPKQKKLINISMLTEEEIIQLNLYHLKCRNIIGPLLAQQGQLEAKKWLWRETEPIVCDVNAS